MVKKFRRVVTGKAERFDGSKEMMSLYKIYRRSTSFSEDKTYVYYLPTYRGDLQLWVGDWIITSSEREVLIVRNEDFKNNYSDLPVIAGDIAVFIEEAHQKSLDVGKAIMEAFEFGNSSDINKRAYSEWVFEHSNKFVKAYLDGYVCGWERLNSVN